MSHNSELTGIVIILSVLSAIVIFFAILGIKAAVDDKKRRKEQIRKDALDKENKAAKAMELDSKLRGSGIYKRQGDAALKFLSILLPEYEARDIVYRIEDKLANLYQTLTEQNRKGWNCLNIEWINEKYLTEENIFKYFFEEEAEIGESGYIGFAAQEDDMADVSHLFTFEVISDMLKKLNYKDADVLTQLKSAVKNIGTFEEYLKVCGNILEKKGYRFIVFSDEIFEGEYNYTVISKEKYEEMSGLLKEIGYEAVERL